MKNNTARDSMIQQNAFSLRMRRNRKSTRWYCTAFVQNGKTLHRRTCAIFHSKKSDLEPVHSATACGLHVRRRGFQPNGDEQQFPKNTRFHTVRATTSANTDRTQRCTQCAGIAGLEKTFRSSRITLVRNPAAELIRMKAHVSSDSTWCVGISNPDPSNNWQPIWVRYGTDMDLTKY